MYNNSHCYLKHTHACKVGAAKSRECSEEVYGEGGGNMEGVFGPHSDMMEEVGGSYKPPSWFFSSCIQDMM